MNIPGHQNGLLIRIDSSIIEFPNICAICGERATHHRIVSKSNRNKLKSRTSNYYWGRRPSNPSSIRGETRRLRIPVCDDHYRTIEEMDRVNLLMGIIAGISILLFAFIGAVIAFHHYDSIAFPIEGCFAFFLVTIIMIQSFRSLGPDELQKVISIVDFHHHGHIIFLRIKNTSYGEEILRNNPSSAQSVRFRNS